MTRADIRRSAGAFTLIEILMALMIVSIGLASVLSVFIVGIHASRDVIDESATAIAAKAVLARVLFEDEMDGAGAAVSDGRRDYIQIIRSVRENNDDWVWLHDKNIVAPYSGTVADNEDAIPAPAEVAQNSIYSWRCRASRHRGDPANSTISLVDDSGNPILLLTGRIPLSQVDNPDSDELWRLTIEIFRDFDPADETEPLARFDTYICTAHE